MTHEDTQAERVERLRALFLSLSRAHRHTYTRSLNITLHIHQATSSTHTITHGTLSTQYTQDHKRALRKWMCESVGEQERVHEWMFYHRLLLPSTLRAAVPAAS